MKRFLLYSLCCILMERVPAQHNRHHTIPEFAKMPELNKFDSINQWYINNVYLPPVNISIQERALIMSEARAYADRSDDKATKVSMKYFTGHFISVFEKDSTRGMQYMLEARDLAEALGLRYEWASYTHAFGVYNMVNHPSRGLEYMARAVEVMDKIGPADKMGILNAKHILGTHYFHLRNYGSSIQTLIPVIEKWGNRAVRIDILQANNTVGLAYREIGKNDSALLYFRKVLTLAEDTPIYRSWIGIANGNIGSIYLKIRQLDSALVYATQGYELVKDDPSVSGVGVAEALVLLCEVYLEQHKTERIVPMLLTAEKLINAKQLYYLPNVDYLRLRLNYVLARAYYENGNEQLASTHLEKALNLQNQLSIRDNGEMYTKVQEHLAAEKNISNIKEAENLLLLSEQRKNFSIAGLCLIGLIFFSLYRRQRIRNRQNRELFRSKEALLLMEKRRALENLESYMINLQEKNKLIEHVEEEIAVLETEVDGPEKKEIVEVLNKLKRSTIITQDDWTQFKILFERTHKDFFEKLRIKFPDITQAEMRMMALMKLDIPTRKMADMLGISPESIRKTQYRFMKKIDASGVSDLNKIVNSL